MAVAEHDYAKFLADRAGGYAAEQWLIDLLAAKGYAAERFDDQNTHYDVRRADGTTYEVKRDRRAYDSFGAIYVEGYNSWRPSGIHTAVFNRVDWWVHLVGGTQDQRLGEAFFYRPAALLELCLKQNPVRLIACGAGPSSCFKIPTAVAREHAARVVPHGLA